MISTVCARRQCGAPTTPARRADRGVSAGAGRLASGCWIATALVLGGCGLQPIAQDGSLLGLITPYRIDIVQGNVVTREQVARVRPGMSRSQVRDLLGSPMLSDPFHANRWDYFFSFRRAGLPMQQRSVVAHFDGEVLARLEVPEGLPSEVEFVASLEPSGKRRASPPPALQLTAEQKAALPSPPRSAPAPAAPSGPVRTYPPLEPP